MKRYVTSLAIGAFTLVATLVIDQSYALPPAPLSGPAKPMADSPGKLPDSKTLIEQAKAAVAENRPSVRIDLNNLFLALLRSTDLVEQYHLIDAIHDIGDLRYGSSPVAVKTYIQRLTLIVLPELPKSIQSYASTKWGHLFLSRKKMEQEIGLITPENRAKEAEGLRVLRKRELGVSYDSLQQAIDNADIELTQALLQAGLRVDMANIVSTNNTVRSSLHSACRNPTLPAHRINEILDLLAANDYPINYADNFGHTLLSSTAMYCSGAVVEHIIGLGAPASQRDRKGITPLELALSNERFDVADVLMKHGARLSVSAGKRVLFFPRRDARLEDYVKRATQPIGDAEK